MTDHIKQWLSQWDPVDNLPGGLSSALALLVLLLGGYVVYFVAKHYMMPQIRRAVGYFKPHLVGSIDGLLLKLTNQLSRLVACLFCLVFFDWFVPQLLPAFVLFYKCLFIFFYFNLALGLISLINIGTAIYNLQHFAKNVPIEGIIQIVKLVVFIVCLLLIVAQLLDMTPWYLLSSLGALAAVFLLIFKDTILGFVAGSQIAAHRLVADGDWIEVPQYGANGEVLEVGLHMVKVRNWDKTITTIPTHKLISDSFKNWRGMSESGGRRIKRAIHLDLSGVAFINQQTQQQMLNRIANQDFADYCNAHGSGETNLGLFRRYCAFYLQQSPLLNDQMTMMARQLEPGVNGVGIELYCFCRDKGWVAYEHIQAELVEHLLAHAGSFDLRLFQHPTGNDFQALRP